MEIVIGIIMYIVFGLIFLVVIETDDDIHVKINNIEAVLLWPVYIATVIVGCIACVINLLVEKLSGGE